MDDASVFLDALAVAASDAMTKSCATRMTPSCRPSAPLNFIGPTRLADQIGTVALEEPRSP
jgi:hypothetical protein